MRTVRQISLAIPEMQNLDVAGTLIFTKSAILTLTQEKQLHL